MKTVRELIKEAESKLDDNIKMSMSQKSYFIILLKKNLMNFI